MKDIFTIKGKIIVLTGGSGFLGSQFKRHLTSCGAKVVIFDNRAENPVDIANPMDVNKAIDKTLELYKRIDGMVHVAAINAVPGSETSRNFWKPYEKYPLELWKKELDVNLTAAHIVAQAVAPAMMKQKSGSIVFLASDLAVIAPNNSIYQKGNFKDIAYVTSKTGLLGLMRSWASYLGKYNIRVNAAVPGGMYNGQAEDFVKKNSALNMLGRMAKKDEYNGVIQFLLSDASSYMTGASLIIDGGRTAW
jgi:NAD(P)-dependent dehydrogenase (short-subunit alcohol dehydrogenase family)